MAQASSRRLQFKRSQLVLTLLLLLALYVVVPQLSDFHNSWQLLKHPRLGWLLAAIGFTSLTYFAAAITYCMLAFRRLPYWRTVVMESASSFVNRLLPGGLGALGANYTYLRHQKHTVAQAGSIVAINNLLGFLGHSLLLVVALAVTARSADSMTHGVTATIIKLSLAVLLLVILAAVVFGRQKVDQAVIDIRQQLVIYRRRPERLIGALLSSLALTICNVLCLYCCMVALDVHLSIMTIFLIFSIGAGAGTATPTPGGLGGFEAGLAGGLTAYHVAGSTAIAIALLYRLASYWLALIVGALAFFVAQRRQWFRTE